MPKGLRKIIHLEALSNVKADAYRRALDAIGLKRRNPSLSLSKAAKASGTTLRTMRKHVAAALRTTGRRLDVTPRDRLTRPMRMLTPKAEVTVVTKDSRTATLISDHYNALRNLKQNPSALKRFEGKVIRSGGVSYEFATDIENVNRLIRAGAVHFLDIYATEPEP
ncbi:MAG TPA: hypothetical protein VKR56_15880 [Candidatus Cybelea sp.]|nr:hypothetical protein [Candidatus Cybelea sp.]